MSLPILAIGQSNIEGGFGPALPAPAHDKAVRAYNLKTMQWTPAQLGVSPFRNIVRSKAPAHNFVFEFAHQYASQCADDADLVLLASGGKRIEFFLPGEVLAANGWTNEQTDPLFGASLSEHIFGAEGAARAALKAAGHEAYGVVLIHQGEANFAQAPIDTLEDYKSKLRLLLSGLQQRALIREDTPVILGEINPTYLGAATHKQALASLVDRRICVVTWDGGVEDVKAVTGDNNPHATGRGLSELGKRYFKAFIAMRAKAAG